MKYLIVILLPLLLVACGKKEDTALKPDQIDITCKTLRNENPTDCVTNTGTATPSNEICKMGFGPVALANRVIPSAIKSYVDSGQVKLYNTKDGKYMKLTTVTGTPNYLILQNAEDPGLTSTVTLPACPSE